MGKLSKTQAYNPQNTIPEITGLKMIQKQVELFTASKMKTLIRIQKLEMNQKLGLKMTSISVHCLGTQLNGNFLPPCSYGSPHDRFSLPISLQCSYPTSTAIPFPIRLFYRVHSPILFLLPLFLFAVRISLCTRVYSPRICEVP